MRIRIRKKLRQRICSSRQSFGIALGQRLRCLFAFGGANRLFVGGGADLGIGFLRLIFGLALRGAHGRRLGIGCRPFCFLRILASGKGAEKHDACKQEREKGTVSFLH